MQQPMTPADLLVQLRADSATVADISTLDGDDNVDPVVVVTVSDGNASTIHLTGTFAQLHRLVIDLDRQLTTMARRPSLVRR